MEKPDKKAYPDYYDIISEPIDMNMIDGKINKNIYRFITFDFFEIAFGYGTSIKGSSQV
jgi:hypothetical protein